MKPHLQSRAAEIGITTITAPEGENLGWTPANLSPFEWLDAPYALHDGGHDVEAITAAVSDSLAKGARAGLVAGIAWRVETLGEWSATDELPG